MRFCIVGTGRCGSTLLRNLLNLHPDVFVFNETHWVPKMHEAVGHGVGDPETFISIIERTRHVTGAAVTPIDGDDLRRQFSDVEEITLRDFCDRVGARSAADVGKTSWADKTPDYGPHIELLQRIWPDCRFVHIIRDPVEVVSSMAGHPGYRWLAAASEVWWGPPSFNGYYAAIGIEERPLADFVRLWHLRMARIRDELTRVRAGTFIEIRFDELLAGPTASLQRVAEFLDLPPGEEWLRAARAIVAPGRPRSNRPRAVADLFTGAAGRLYDELQ